MLGGRVDLDQNGEPQFQKAEKLTRFDLCTTGVENGKLIKQNSLQLVLSVVPFIIIQAFSFQDVHSGPSHDMIVWPAWVAIFFTVILFVA